jgi:hypothetical protein
MRRGESDARRRDENPNSAPMENAKRRSVWYAAESTQPHEHFERDSFWRDFRF